jgi:hypothetical protein
MKNLVKRMWSDERGYLDPATINIVLQALIGVFAASLVLLKVYWTKVKEFFKTKFAKGKNVDTPR